MQGLPTPTPISVHSHVYAPRYTTGGAPSDIPPFPLRDELGGGGAPFSALQATAPPDARLPPGFRPQEPQPGPREPPAKPKPDWPRGDEGFQQDAEGEAGRPLKEAALPHALGPRRAGRPGQAPQEGAEERPLPLPEGGRAPRRRQSGPHRAQRRRGRGPVPAPLQRRHRLPQGPLQRRRHGAGEAATPLPPALSGSQSATLAGVTFGKKHRPRRS